MVRVSEAVELLEEAPEIRSEEVQTLLAREAVLVERLAGELKAGRLGSPELPARLELPNELRLLLGLKWNPTRSHSPSDCPMNQQERD